MPLAREPAEPVERFGVFSFHFPAGVYDYWGCSHALLPQVVTVIDELTTPERAQE